jgi:hypothetical protein
VLCGFPAAFRLFSPLFRALEEEPPPVNRAHTSVSPCLREKFGEENVLYALALAAWLCAVAPFYLYISNGTYFAIAVKCLSLVINFKLF